MKCGLLGRKLGHSYSPQIHSFLGSYSYHLYEKEPDELEYFLKNDSFSGINVTIPYKKQVIPYLDALSPAAQTIGSVNTIIRRPDGTLFGHNTDYFGFASMISHSGLSVADKKVLVLGSGGASCTAVEVLKELGAEVVVISRNGKNNYDTLYAHSDAAVIVNATPVGMYPHTGTAPVDLSLFPHLEGVMDLIYNPARTQLLQEAEQRGIVAENGLWMLIAQAKEASEYFAGSSIEDCCIGKIYNLLQQQMQNIILIGMPGCGKSTIGKHLAGKLGKVFVDADSEIIYMAGKSIPEIFAEDGEETFREFETRVLGTLGRESGLVIATGGGCVTQERNYPLLHQNGTIIWLKRDLDLLPTDGRPLSQANKLHDLYLQRASMYEAFSDIIIDNNRPAEETVAAICSKLEEEK